MTEQNLALIKAHAIEECFNHETTEALIDKLQHEFAFGKYGANKNFTRDEIAEVLLPVKTEFNAIVSEINNKLTGKHTYEVVSPATEELPETVNTIADNTDYIMPQQLSASIAALYFDPAQVLLHLLAGSTFTDYKTKINTTEEE